jgi:hypothetical protein
MTLEGMGVTQRDRYGPFQIRLKFGKQAYCVVEVAKGQEHQEVVPSSLRSSAAAQRER